jgi:hypothetical protein
MSAHDPDVPTAYNSTLPTALEASIVLIVRKIVYKYHMDVIVMPMPKCAQAATRRNK